jgi:hypothetical protein
MTASPLSVPDGLDSGIAPWVHLLRSCTFETFESCEGGEGHAYPIPTIRFSGERSEGFRALALLLQRGVPVAELLRVWPVLDGEPTGPYWQVTFSRKAISLER